ncbi:Protein regulator of cytokinesis 1 [Araneus ventricosus]|uniref:Protein regulator of cytokinesis 1 n=1 Tax=Araneus ventricosus TaxID=182803 RepID=A0A4Y2U047_ARAVE|nr:Protein regulator of cytokinesis 1 [Araneus ventricosus]
MEGENQQQENSENVLDCMEQEGIKQIQNNLKKLYNLWNEFGIDSKRKIRRAEKVWNHMQNLIQDIYREENDLYKELQERVNDYTQKIDKLARSLAVIPKEITGPLAKREELLHLELEKLNEALQIRLKSYQHLKSIETKYCKILGTEEYELPSESEVPSQDDMKNLEQRIKALKEERDRRHKKFCLVRKDLTVIMETTELEPETSLEKDILSGKDTLSLSDETMKSLEEILYKVQRRKAELETRKKELMDHLSYLWERLKVGEKVRVEFISRHENCCRSILRSIEEEIEKYKLLRKENIHAEIASLRKEIEQLWCKCCMSDREREAFGSFSSSEMTEEVLETHEAELKRLQHYYEDIALILKKINERQQLWNKLIEFENKANNPNRFKNRGGNLLREERERKMLRKNLPKLEDEIFHEIEKFEARNKTVFLYYGEDFRIYVTNQWAEREDQKENERNKRHEKRLVGIEGDTLLGTPFKRSLIYTPKTAPSKLFKSNAGSAYSTPMANSKLKCGTPGLPLNKKLFPSNKSEKKGSKAVLKQKQQLVKLKNVPSSRTPTYTDFIGELTTPGKMNHQSSILASRRPEGKRMFSSNKGSERKNAVKPFPKSIINSPLTPTRGKVGLPFII